MTTHRTVILLLPPLLFDVAKSMPGCCHKHVPDVLSAGFPGLSSAKESAEVTVVPEARHAALATFQHH